MAPLSFHIRHEVTPDRCSEVFSAIVAGLPYLHVLQSDRQVTRLRNLGLLIEDDLSLDGQALARICASKPSLWADLLHYLHYTRWSSVDPVTHGFSWVYRQFTNLLWYESQVYVDDTFLKPAVATLIGTVEAESVFASVIKSKTRAGSVSLSTSSLVGALSWLSALQPPVLHEQRFSRRFFCSPELMILALGWVARTTNSELGIDVLLSPERRGALCMLCLLDPASLDRAIDWALPLYADCIRPGTRAGSYGRFVRFARWPQLADLVTL